MRKKISALVLAATLLFSLAAPAYAASEALDSELARITKTVKDTLGIDNSYSKFSGSVSDSSSNRYWHLNWSSDAVNINVTADANGKVLNYYRYKNEYEKGPIGYAPSFPKTTKEDVLPAAKAFLDKVLGSGESVKFDDTANEKYASSYGSGSYSFGGTILLNGIKSPITFHVNISTSDMSVSSFSRNDGYGRYSGSVPSPTASVTPDTAAKLLNSKLQLKLQYVLSDDGKTALVQYVPFYTGNYIVKADTGELVNTDSDVSTYPAEAYDMGMGGSTKSASANQGLSTVELSAVSELESVMPKDKLDASLRAISGLGLDENYSLDSANFSKDSESGKIYCTLSYVKKISDTNVIKDMFPDYYTSVSKSSTIRPISIYKYVMVDAKTAEIKNISGGKTASGSEKKVFNAEALEAKAAQFLKNNLGSMFQKTTLNKESSTPDNGYFVYSQTVNGIQFPQNSLSITIDTYDGYVSGLNYSWKDGYNFDSADGLVSPDAAINAYVSCFEPVLQYVYTQAKTEPVTRALSLAYKLDAKSNVAGIDAKTGKPIIPTPASDITKLAYDDIENCYGKMQIEALANYGIGFQGKSFLPENQLTQKDALVMLLSAVGYKSDGDDTSLYETAYRYGLVSSGEKSPDKLLSRIEYIKMLVGATEYGSAAKLSGIYICGFSDDSEIPSEYYGFAAIAKALGIIKGDAENKFTPSGSATRQDAAIMLYNFMSRK